MQQLAFQLQTNRATCTPFQIKLSFGKLMEKQMRSSAQGNCSAKSLAGNVVNSSLSSLSSTSHAIHGGSKGGGSRGGGSGKGLVRGVKGEGAGDISSTLPYAALPHGASA